MTNAEISRWLAGLKNDIGQSQYQPLWHYAEALDMASFGRYGTDKENRIAKIG